MLKQYAVPVVALTATATSVTVDLIKQTLNMQNPVVISVPFYRSNLKFEILEKKPNFSAAMKQVAELVHVSIFGGLSGSEDRGRGDNSIQFINIGRVGDKSFKE